MNKLKQKSMPFLLLIALALMTTGTACQNLEKNAYRTIGTTAVLVDGAMNGWGDYVRAGKASAEDEAAVKATYQKYQRSMATLRSAVVAYKTAPEGQAALETALQAVSAASGELILLIEQLSNKK